MENELLVDSSSKMIKLIEKYNDLAREALSNGDKILSENYFQHADHFMRILNDREIQKKLNLSNSDLPNKEKKFINENSIGRILKDFVFLTISCICPVIKCHSVRLSIS